MCVHFSCADTLPCAIYARFAHSRAPDTRYTGSFSQCSLSLQQHFCLVGLPDETDYNQPKKALKPAYKHQIPPNWTKFSWFLWSKICRKKHLNALFCHPKQRNWAGNRPIWQHCCSDTSVHFKVSSPLPGICMDRNFWPKFPVWSVLHHVVQGLEKFHHGQILFKSKDTKKHIHLLNMLNIKLFLLFEDVNN